MEKKKNKTLKDFLNRPFQYGLKGLSISATISALAIYTYVGIQSFQIGMGMGRMIYDSPEFSKEVIKYMDKNLNTGENILLFGTWAIEKLKSYR